MSLEYLFRPRSIAVVGASHDPAKLGHVLLKNILDYKFAGKVYPVNPAGGVILDKKVYKSLLDLDGVPDLVLVSVPNQVVPAVIKDAASAGAKSVVILSSGFAEMGNEGKEGQTLILSHCKNRMRILGPNCMGIYNINARLNATYFWQIPRMKGNISFVSQSGAYGGMLFSQMQQRNMGMSKFVSIGNQADISNCDVLDFLRDDPDTQVIALFIEEIKNGRKFMDSCIKATRKKPIIAFKVGRTKTGTSAALSHTGSIAGDNEVCTAALKQAGVIIARNTQEFFDYIMTFHFYPKTIPKADGLAILTISGGPCVAASDYCDEIGIEVPPINQNIQNKIRGLIPSFGASRNPVDMTPQMNPKNFHDCVNLVSSQKDIGGILAINIGLDRPEYARAFVSAKKRYKKPVFSFLVDDPTIHKIFSENQIPAFDSPEMAAQVYLALLERKKIIENLPVPFFSRFKPATAQDIKVLDEHESKVLLKSCDLSMCPEAIVYDWPDLLKSAQSIGYPVTLKIFGMGAHKTDKGGVILNIRDRDELKEAFDKLKPICKTILVQKMIKGDHELIIGCKHDPIFGPVIIFGTGGVWVNVLKDTAIRICPVTKKDAILMIKETRAFHQLKGARGKKPVDIDKLADHLVKFSKFIISNAQIKEIDINPLIVQDNRFIVVDALVLKGG